MTRDLDKMFLLIANQITAMLAYWDKNLVCRFANDAYLDWFGKTREEMVGKMRLDELLGPTLYEKNLPYINEALSGNKQLFERDIPLPSGAGLRSSLATYIPEVYEGEVLGFIVHVADVTHLKNLEREVLKAKKEVLQKIIETEENEKKYLVENLRENINQKLAACKLLLESEHRNSGNYNYYKEVDANIGVIIKEINLLCQDLTPAELEIFRLKDTIGHLLRSTAADAGIEMEFCSNKEDFKNVPQADVLAIFRIFQNLVKIIAHTPDCKKLKFTLEYNAPVVTICLHSNCKITLNRKSKEYSAIACRIDYYSGYLNEFTKDQESIIEIEINVSEDRELSESLLI